MPPGFLGTEADLLMDLLVTVVPGILVVMALSWRFARSGAWTTHRNIQVVLTIILALAVTALEVHIATSGGIEALLGGGEPPAGLRGMLNIHLLFAFSASLTWIGLVVTSLIKFPNPPSPGAFSARHRFVGRVGMVTMVGTAITAVAVYAVAFVF